VNRIAKKAITVTTQKATHRKASTTTCGSSKSHFTSHNHRERASNDASTRTGYGVRFSVTVPPHG
jgi:hypothetical protein